MYVDGFVIPIPKKNLAAYQRIASDAGKVWMDHGALEYLECVGDDLEVKMGKSFSAQLGLKKSETVVFAWVVYRSRAHRDQVNKKVMKDPRMAGMDEKPMPFDVTRMCYAGFKPIVELRAGEGRAAKRAPRRSSRANGRAEASTDAPRA